MAAYIILRIFIFFIGLLPFRIMYILSDFLAWLAYRQIGYRKKVVLENLRGSFPEKTEEEIDKIAADFYRNLSDITLEGIKIFSMDPAKNLDRYRIADTSVFDKYANNNQSAIALSVHYCNWEWGARMFSKQLDNDVVILYKPLNNKRTDNFMRGMNDLSKVLVPINKTREIFEEKVNNSALFVMLADQSPSNLERAYKTTFLNRPTACLHGPEYYARKYNLPLVFGYISRTKRGYYQSNVSVLVENPRDYPEGELTAIYMQKVEEIIRENPANWLWSHKRWKHKVTL